MSYGNSTPRFASRTSGIGFRSTDQNISHYLPMVCEKRDFPNDDVMSVEGASQE
jgi:hypothetical protein